MGRQTSHLFIVIGTALILPAAASVNSDQSLLPQCGPEFVPDLHWTQQNGTERSLLPEDTWRF